MQHKQDRFRCGSSLLGSFTSRYLPVCMGGGVSEHVCQGRCMLLNVSHSTRRLAD
jgi:hypothetical protein